MGPPRALVRILQVVPAQTNRLHQGESSWDFVDERVVGCQLLGLAHHRLDQHHVRPPAEEVVVACIIGCTYPGTNRVVHRHVQHRDRIASHSHYCHGGGLRDFWVDVHRRQPDCSAYWRLGLICPGMLRAPWSGCPEDGHHRDCDVCHDVDCQPEWCKGRTRQRQWGPWFGRATCAAWCASEAAPWCVRSENVGPVLWAPRQVLVAPKYQSNWG